MKRKCNRIICMLVLVLLLAPAAVLAQKKVLIINGHYPHEVSSGKLNKTMVEKATQVLENKGYEVKTSVITNYEIEKEVEKILWADVVIFQYPINWMNTPWAFKKYLDEVLWAGIGGVFANGDGRTSAMKTPAERGEKYGTGGLLTNKKYMLSITSNAPKEAFDNPKAFLFQGKGLEDLLFPMHAALRFNGMQKIPSFGSHDVMKNPKVEEDLKRLEKHINKHF